MSQTNTSDLMPSQAERYNSLSLGQRLRAERKRIGATQAALADMGGIKRNALFKYEKGENSPTVEFLYRLSENGLDAAYVFTGVHVESSLRPNEQILLGCFRKLPPHHQQIAMDTFAVLTGDRSGKAIDEREAA
jgi:transcriptional regulator with XRE-family HTH domain